MTYAGLSFTVFAAFLVPLVLAVLVGIKRRPLFASVCFGALCFFVFQVLTRIPLLQLVLPGMDWYITFISTQPVLYLLFLSLTAALFEEIGRYLIMRFFMKQRRTVSDALAFGLGHGSIESILLVGLPTLTALLTQSTDLALIAPTAAAAGGVERLSTIVIHIGLSVMVMQSLKKGSFFWLLIAIFLHTSVNFISVYALNIMGLNLLLVELIIILFAALMGYHAHREYKFAKAKS